MAVSNIVLLLLLEARIKLLLKCWLETAEFLGVGGGEGRGLQKKKDVVVEAKEEGGDSGGRDKLRDEQTSTNALSTFFFYYTTYIPKGHVVIIARASTISTVLLIGRGGGRAQNLVSQFMNCNSAEILGSSTVDV